MRVRADPSVIIRIRNIIIIVTRIVRIVSTTRQRLCTERKRFIHETLILKFVFRIFYL